MILQMNQLSHKINPKDRNILKNQKKYIRATYLMVLCITHTVSMQIQFLGILLEHGPLELHYLV